MVIVMVIVMVMVMVMVIVMAKMMVAKITMITRTMTMITIFFLNIYSQKKFFQTFIVLF